MNNTQTMDIDELLVEWSYRVHNGAPNPKNPNDIHILRTILTEQKFKKDWIGQFIAEISATEKASVATVIEKLLKMMIAFKTLTTYNFAYPPRMSTIAKEGNLFTVKIIIEAKGIDNTQRDDAFNDVKDYFIQHRYKCVRKHSKEMPSSVGYLEIAISPTIRVWLAIKGMAKLESGALTDTNIKEGIAVMMYQMNWTAPLTGENITQFKHEFLAKTDYHGESEENMKKIRDFMKNSSMKLGDFLRFLNQLLSQAMTFKTGYKKWVIDRDQIFNKIRKAASQAAGTFADKWCPADIYLINPKNYKKINEVLASLSTLKEPADRIAAINSLFVSEWGGTDKSIVGVSLKMAQAQGGKAKDFLKRFDAVERTYNLSADDLAMKGPALIIAVNEQRKLLKKQIKNSDVEIIYNPPKDCSEIKDREKLISKLASLKIINFLLSKADKDQADDMIVAAIGFGLSLSGINPDFFKVVGNKMGTAESPQKFKAGGVVTLYPNGPDRDQAEIVILDSNTNMGVSCNLTIEKGSQICNVRLTARPFGYKQATLEIEKISCKVQA